MRFLKITLAIFLVMAMLLTTVLFNRSSVVSSLVNSYLSQYQSALTCIDFALDENDDLIISRLCIDSPYGEVELVDTLIAWRFDPRYLEADKLIDAISAIHISSAKVRAKNNIQFSHSSTAQKLKLNALPALIRQELQQAQLLTPPVDIEVQSFIYSPFAVEPVNKNLSYQGEFSITKQHVSFSLGEVKAGDFLSFDMSKEAQSFNANLTAELAKTTEFLQKHKTALPTDFAALITDAKWLVSGQIESQINWQEQQLKISNQLTDFSLQQGKNKLNTSLTLQVSVHDETLKIDFPQANKLQIIFDHAGVIKLLSDNSVEPQLISFLNDNVMNSLDIEPSGSLKVDFAKQVIKSEGIDFTSNNLNKPIKLALDNLLLNYQEEAVAMLDLKSADFSFAGPLKLAQLNSFTKQPVVMNIAGDIKHHSDSWQLKLAPNSAITLSQLALPADIANSNTKASNKKAQPSINSLLSHWQGNVTIPQQFIEDTSPDFAKISFDFQIDNQIKKLNIPKVLQLPTLDINSEFKGNITDIAIKANVIADKLAIASVNVGGDILQPQLEVQAKDLLLSDLLTLKIELPVEIKLIDGMLDYHLSGQLKNTDNLIANPLKLALSVKDLTGEVDGTWLQELNWQQKFMIKSGQVKSLVDADNSENNLTITKIETATPITHLSTRTFIAFEQNELAVKVNNTRGKLLGGRFDIPQAQWPFSKGSAVNVKLTKIDLEKLLELDKKQGIVVTGRVSGNLPVYYDGKHFLVKEGSLHNVGDGLIQVYNNPAVEELKATSTELKLAFDALENLHYHHLSSDVSMADDGYMLLVTAVKGKNPDLDNDVNLNLNLSYDLLGLLESLNITEHFESKVIKGLQH